MSAGVVIVPPAPAVGAGTCTLGVITPKHPIQAEYYSGSLTGYGGTAPYSFKQAGGSLPTGLTMNSQGAITGVAPEAGSSTFEVQVTDSSVPSCVSTLSVTMTVDPNPGLNGLEPGNLVDLVDAVAALVLNPACLEGVVATLLYGQPPNCPPGG